MPFYNCHIHIFSAQCAPKRFLQVGLPGWLDFASGGIKGFLETGVGRGIMGFLAKRKSKPLRVLARYGSFASVGTKPTQQMVFENILPFYPNNARFVVLTLNMDHMGAGDSELKYQGQIDEVVALRRKYPDACLPFLSVDPRMGSEKELEDFVKRYIGPGGAADGPNMHRPFVGVKLYPALGYFPYDARLRGVYRYCEANNIPIMTHCTPDGSFFLGKLTASMGAPEAIGGAPAVQFGKGDNLAECDVFLFPEQWRYVFKEFPKLKVCFAHMGGWGEMFPDKARAAALAGAPSWYEKVLHLMERFPNVYTDVSYTLAETKAEQKSTPRNRSWEEVLALLRSANQSLTVGTPTGRRPPTPWIDAQGSPLPPLPPPLPLVARNIHERILFGTDYFMTEQEEPEEDLAMKLPDWLLKKDRNLYLALTEKNPARYLTSAFYMP